MAAVRQLFRRVHVTGVYSLARVLHDRLAMSPLDLPSSFARFAAHPDAPKHTRDSKTEPGIADPPVATLEHAPPSTPSSQYQAGSAARAHPIARPSQRAAHSPVPPHIPNVERHLRAQCAVPSA